MSKQMSLRRGAGPPPDLTAKEVYVEEERECVDIDRENHLRPLPSALLIGIE